MRLHITLILAFYTEKLHRFLFDKVYVAFEYSRVKEFTRKQRLAIFLYNILIKFNPNFRRALKHHKELFKRAYKLQRLPAQYFYFHKMFRFENYKRYN